MSSKDCLKDVLSIKNATTAQPLHRMWPLALRLRICIEFTKTWNDEFYSDVKSQEKIDLETIEFMRGILSDFTGKNDLFGSPPFSLNSVAAEGAKI